VPKSLATIASSRVLIVLTSFIVAFTLVAVSINSHAATSTLTKTITSGADDARSPDSGAFTSTETSALIGAGNGSQANVAGFRFAGITVPPGSVITGVQLSLVADQTTWQRIVVDCAFDASDNAAPFSATAEPAQRSLTSSRVRTDNNIRRSAGKRYTICQGGQLVSALQEVISRPGWASGNAVALIAAGPASPTWARLAFSTSEAGVKRAPQLTINYTSPSGVPATSTATKTSTSTATKTSTSTATKTSTSTATKTSTSTATPTNTATATTPTSGGTTPVAGQPCPAWVHDQYVAKGPDGNMYPTWHPPVDPVYGCSFGHEHGDNPNNSPAMRGRQVVFGYASLKAGMSEPHTGFKVAVWSQEKDTHNTPNSHMNSDAVWVVHQGTGGAARFTQPFHSLELHYYNAKDGREIHAYVLGNFADTIVRGTQCGSPDKVITDNPGSGSRQLVGPNCFDDGYMSGKQYEDWVTAVYLGVDKSGNYKAYFDPHFAIFNPNTYCDLQPDNTCKLGYSDTALGTGQDPTSTSAWFKGDHRETYMNQLWFFNQGGSTSIWTDPYGNLVAPGSPGAIEQYVAAMNWKVQDPSNAFGANRNYDQGGTVHAPN
jgi:hypothetical protein